MSEGIEYGVSLDDGMSGPAKAASQAVADLGVSLGGLKKHAEESHSILGKLGEGFIRTVEPAEILKGAFEGVSEGFHKFTDGLKAGEAKEAISGIAESMAGLAQMLDLVVPGLGQLAAAAIKAGGAIASMLVGIIQGGMEMAIEATQGKLAMVSMFAALGGGQKVGEETEEMLVSLSDQIGVTKDTLAPFTKAFMAMGVEGKDALEKVTLAAVSAQAIMGDPAAAHAFENLTKKIQVAAQTGHGLKIPEKGLKSLADMGLRVDDVAKRMGISSNALSAQLKAGAVNATKFGDALQDALIEKGAGPLARMGSSLANMKKMFGQSIEDMFEDMGPAIEPFLNKMKDLLGLFSQNTESGKVMKDGIGQAFTYMFDIATQMIEPIGHLFLDLIIFDLKVAIQIKEHWLSIQAIFGSTKTAIDLVVWAFKEAGKELNAFGNTITRIGNAVDRAKAALGGGLQGVGEKTGRSMGDGVAAGLDASGNKVVAAGKDLADKGSGAVADQAQVKSPSRVMFRLGGFMGQGVALGMHASTQKVATAGRTMGTVAAQGTGAGLQASDYTPRRGDNRDGPREKSGMTVQGGIHVTIQAPNGVTHAGELTEAGLAIVFERLALSQGID